MRLNGNYCWKDETEEPYASSLVTNIMSATFACHRLCVCVLLREYCLNQMKYLCPRSTYSEFHMIFIKIGLGNVVCKVVCWLMLHHALKPSTEKLLYLVRDLSAAKQDVEVGHGVLDVQFLWLHKNIHKSSKTYAASKLRWMTFKLNVKHTHSWKCATLKEINVATKLAWRQLQQTPEYMTYRCL